MQRTTWLEVTDWPQLPMPVPSKLRASREASRAQLLLDSRAQALLDSRVDSKGSRVLPLLASRVSSRASRALHVLLLPLPSRLPLLSRLPLFSNSSVSRALLPSRALLLPLTRDRLLLEALSTSKANLIALLEYLFIYRLNK